MHLHGELHLSEGLAEEQPVVPSHFSSSVGHFKMECFCACVCVFPEISGPSSYRVCQLSLGLQLFLLLAFILKFIFGLRDGDSSSTFYQAHFCL